MLLQVVTESMAEHMRGKLLIPGRKQGGTERVHERSHTLITELLAVVLYAVT